MSCNPERDRICAYLTTLKCVELAIDKTNKNIDEINSIYNNVSAQVAAKQRKVDLLKSGSETIRVDDVSTGGCLVSCLGPIVSIFLIVIIIKNKDRLRIETDNVLFHETDLGGFSYSLILSLLAIIIGVLIAAYGWFHVSRKQTEKKVLKERKMELPDAQKQLLQAQRIANECENNVKTLIPTLKASLEKLRDQRKELYSANYIQSNMRDIYGVCYLEDYMRTTQFDFREAVLNYKLDDIRAKLDKMIEIGEKQLDNQYQIMNQNQTLLQEFDRMNGGLHTALINQEISNDIARKQLAYQQADLKIKAFKLLDESLGH